jgi:CheY-like chemotaxis protein
MALVKLMPLPLAPTLLPLFLAALGGVLFFLLLRPRLIPATTGGSSPRAGDLISCMQAPGEPATRRMSASTPAVTQLSFPPPARGELILLIDDEASVRDLLSTVLLNHGYQVLLARNAVEGLQLFSSMPDQISLVLSDVHMPNISGRSFVDLIRPIRPDVRILLMSGLDGSESGVGPVNSRDPFLLKPFKPAELLGKIHELLQPDAPPGS